MNNRRLEEVPKFQSHGSHPYLKSMHVPPDDNPYLWNSKVVSTQKPTWNRRAHRDVQNPYALTGTGTNYNYPLGEDLDASFQNSRNSGGSQTAYFRHQGASGGSPRRLEGTLGGRSGSFSLSATNPRASGSFAQGRGHGNSARSSERS